MEITSPPLPNIVPKSELMLLLINRGAFNLCSTIGNNLITSYIVCSSALSLDGK